jgi:hypothetical protein
LRDRPVDETGEDERNHDNVAGAQGKSHCPLPKVFCEGGLARTLCRPDCRELLDSFGEDVGVAGSMDLVFAILSFLAGFFTCMPAALISTTSASKTPIERCHTARTASINFM